MATIETFPPFSKLLYPLGGYKIHLSHDEIVSVSNALKPTSALGNLIGIASGEPLAAIVVNSLILYWYIIERTDKKNGGKGCTFIKSHGLMSLPIPVKN